MRRISGLRLTRPAPRRAAVAGTLASTAYLLEQAVDRRAAPNAYDDLVIWGGLFSCDPRRQKLLGAAAHYMVGTLLALVYQTARPSLPRLHGWLRGLAFAEAENALFFPALIGIDRVHPAVRRGALPPLFTWRYFWVEAARHAAYGVVLGVVAADASG